MTDVTKFGKIFDKNSMHQKLWKDHAKICIRKIQSILSQHVSRTFPLNPLKFRIRGSPRILGISKFAFADRKTFHGILIAFTRIITTTSIAFSLETKIIVAIFISEMNLHES